MRRLFLKLRRVLEQRFHDLLPLVQYMAPICPGCGANDRGPVADLLRLNTGLPPAPVANQKRLGFLAGDVAGFPNGRRPIDDVTDKLLKDGIASFAKSFDALIAGLAKKSKALGRELAAR